MDQQGEQNMAHLETQIKNLSEQLTNVADGTDFEELLIIIHRPGWTTPAEALLVSGVVDTMLEQAKVLAGLKQVLINGSRAVGA